MKRWHARKWIAAFAIAALILVEFIPQKATIKLSGPAGLPYSGTIVADGVTKRVSGVLPADFVVNAHSIDCRFKNEQEDGPLNVDITLPMNTRGSAKASKPHGEVRASITAGLLSRFVRIGAS